MGIGKRELLEDYYFDEVGDIIDAWNALHSPPDGAEEQVEPLEFLGAGGEWIT